MLTETVTTKRRVSQAPLKFTKCHAGCGAQVQYRTNARVACDDCSASRKKEQARLTAERKRRSLGVVPVKGTIGLCTDCGETFKRMSVKTHRCQECQAAANLRSANAASQQRLRDKGAPRMGGEIACKHCKTCFIRQTPRECYCTDCRLLQKRGELPSLKAFRKIYAKSYRERQKGDPAYIEQERARQKASREKRKLNPSFSINERMSAAIRASLKGGKNGASWEALVGYSVTDLVRHLERQFLPGMSWDRRSEIHIDHVRPLASFEFASASDDAFRDAWSLHNLRPLWKADNLAKNDQRLFLL